MTTGWWATRLEFAVALASLGIVLVGGARTLVIDAPFSGGPETSLPWTLHHWRASPVCSSGSRG